MYLQQIIFKLKGTILRTKIPVIFQEMNYKIIIQHFAVDIIILSNVFTRQQPR